MDYYCHVSCLFAIGSTVMLYNDSVGNIFNSSSLLTLNARVKLKHCLHYANNGVRMNR